MPKLGIPQGPNKKKAHKPSEKVKRDFNRDPVRYSKKWVEK
jgi:hypothetical protein